MARFLKLNAELFGVVDTKSIVYLTILCDWEDYLVSKKKINRGEVFFLALKDIEQKYFFSYLEQKRCIEELTKAGFISSYAKGAPPKMHFIINRDSIDSKTIKPKNQNLGNQNDSTIEISVSKVIKPEFRNSANPDNLIQEQEKRTKNKNNTASYPARGGQENQQEQKQDFLFFLDFEQTRDKLKADFACREIFVDAIISKLKAESLSYKFNIGARAELYDLIVNECLGNAKVQDKFPRKYTETTKHFVNHLRNKIKRDFDLIVKIIEKYEL